MKRARIAMAIAAASLMLAASLPAAAQTQAPPAMFGPRAGKPGQPKPPEVVASFGKWSLTCEQVAEPDPKDAKAEPKTARSCGVLQTARNEERKNLALTLVFVKAEQDGKEMLMVRVMAPIGVFLPLGVALEIDGQAISRVPFTRCAPQVCMAMGSASPETLDKLKKGKQATFIIYDNPGAGFPMKIDLKGISDALAALDKEAAKK